MKIFLHNDDIPSDIISSSSIAIDTETMGFNITRDRLCLIQLSFGDGNAHLVKFSNNYQANNLKKILTNDNIKKIFHFARFDLAVLYHYLNINFQNIYCTKIASKLTRTYTDAHSLKNLCEELLGIEISKKYQSSDWGVEKLSDKQMEYASNDVIYLHKIMEKLDQMIIRNNREEILKKCFDFLPTRAMLDLAGFSNVDIFSHS
jgi:ribonuclease D